MTLIHSIAEKGSSRKPVSIHSRTYTHRGVGKRNFACSPNYREEFFSETEETTRYAAYRIREKSRECVVVDYLVDLPPGECLDSATRYMVNKGYSIDSRTENSVELSRSPEIGTGTGCLILLAALPSVGLSLVALILVLIFYKWKATIIAAPGPGGETRLTANSPQDGTRKTLQNWVEEELGDRAKPLTT